MKLNVEELEVGMLNVLRIDGVTVVDLVLKIDYENNKINVLSIYFDSHGPFLDSFEIKNGYKFDLSNIISFHKPKRNKQ